MPLRSRPLSSITADDVRTFVGSAPLENETLELKSTLPGKGGESDPWVLGEARIGDRARNEILEEIVAFANARGGLLLLGVLETSDHPKRAAGLQPIRECADLAQRLRLQARDCIEPPIPVLEIEGVAIETDGSGVVIARVAASRAAPHRLIPRLECYARRGDRSQRMTMRDIQDLTLSRARALDVVTAQLDARSAAFRAAVDTRAKQTHGTKQYTKFYATRATAVPVSADLFIPRVYQNPTVSPTLRRIRGAIRGREVAGDFWPVSTSERPIVRGTRLHYQTPELAYWAEVLSSGLVEFGFISSVEVPSDDKLFPEWVTMMNTNALLTADRFRLAAGAAGAEYALDAELYCVGGEMRLTWWGDPARGGGSPGIIEPNPLRFPLMTFAERADIVTVVAALYEDMFNAAGTDIRESVFTLSLPE